MRVFPDARMGGCRATGVSKKLRMQTNGHMRTFEHGRDLIHVHAYKSVVDGWALGVVAVVESRRDGPATARDLAAGDKRFASFDEAIAAGRNMAVAYLNDAHS